MNSASARRESVFTTTWNRLPEIVAERLGFPSEQPRTTYREPVALTLEVTRLTAARVHAEALSTPVDKRVNNLWGAPLSAVDEQGNRMLTEGLLLGIDSGADLRKRQRTRCGHRKVGGAWGYLQEMADSPLSQIPPYVDIRRSKRRKRTVSAYRDGERVVVLMPDRLSAAEEARWVETMLKRLEKQAHVLACRMRNCLPERAIWRVATCLRWPNPVRCGG